jgi:hypothetical protein
MEETTEEQEKKKQEAAEKRRAEEKRLAEDKAIHLTTWKRAVEKYRDLLQETVDALRTEPDSVPANHIIDGFAQRSEEIQRAGQCFRDDVKRTKITRPKEKEKIYF